jgi:ASCH domain
VKTLAIRQPWCTLIAEGIKTIEVRTWRTHYRGPLLIVASGRPYRLQYDDGNAETLPTQCQVCTVDLIDCRPWLRPEAAAACLDDGWDTGYWGWHLATPRHVLPAPHRGRLNLYETPDHLVAPLPGWHYLDYPRAVCQRCAHPPGLDWLDGGQTCPRCKLVATA